MPRRLLLIVSLVIAALAPAVSAPAQPRADTNDSIKALHEQWAKAWRKGDVESLRALYAPDAVLFPTDHSPVDGRNKIGDYLEGLIDASTGSDGFAFVTDMMETSGDLAYDSGLIQYWETGNTAPVKGFYVLILKRDLSGNWLISRQALTRISEPGIHAVRK
jgi:uncharacterized protein (TIGR02246 family)